MSAGDRISWNSSDGFLIKSRVKQSGLENTHKGENLGEDVVGVGVGGCLLHYLNDQAPVVQTLDGAILLGKTISLYSG